MAIPDFQSTMLPLLELASDGKDHTGRDAVESLAAKFKLSTEEQAQLLPSGRAPAFYNRVAWAIFHLKKAKLLDSPKRGHFVVTDRGRDALKKKPKRIDLRFLNQYPEHLAFRSKPSEKAEETETPSPASVSQATPDEEMESAYQRSKEALASELLDTLKKCSPAFFERLVVDLVVSMGYGGTRQDAGKAIGKSGDGGIDGIIKEDRLGLDVIYIQAKRWDGTVGRPEIQKFAGALQGHHAKKGIFLTTGAFSKDARAYASSIDSKISLLDGDDLTELMIDHNVGVSKTATYELKKVDTDYFNEDEP